MSETHTKGPWQVLPKEVDKDYLRIRGTRLGDRYKIANVLSPVPAAVSPGEAAVTYKNARLIAAATEMYEMLQQIYTSSAYTEATEWLPMAEIKALLAKARGEAL